MAGKAPAFQFYPNDWIGDPDLAACSLSTRGFWIACLCRMWHAAERGVLRDKTYEGLGRMAGCTAEEAEAAVTELDAQNVATVTRRNTKVTLENRRMLREVDSRKSNATRQKRHRRKNVTPLSRESNAKVTPPSSSSSSSSTSVTPCSPPFEQVTAEDADAMYAGPTRPPAAQLGDATRHIQQCYYDAFVIDSNVPPVPNFERWVESLLKAAGGGDTGLAFVRSFQHQDFLDAFNSYMDRTNKAQTWSGTWVQNARNRRYESTQEAKADADRAEGRRQAAAASARQQELDAKAVKDADEAARAQYEVIDAAWNKLPMPERKRRIRQNSNSVKLAKTAWWRERNET